LPGNIWIGSLHFNDDAASGIPVRFTPLNGCALNQDQAFYRTGQILFTGKAILRFRPRGARAFPTESPRYQDHLMPP
jgi:hypothetical protein